MRYLKGSVRILSLHYMNGHFYYMLKISSTGCKCYFQIFHYLVCLNKDIILTNDLSIFIYRILPADVNCLAASVGGNYLGKSRVFGESIRIHMRYRSFHHSIILWIGKKNLNHI